MGTASRSKSRTRQREFANRVRWVLALAAATVIVVVVLVASGGSSSGKKAPDIALPNFQGETVRLTDFRGQGLVVNYWASWCVPCLAEMPGFEQVYQRQRADVGFLGINLADNPSSARAVIDVTGVTYPLAVDADGASFAEFGAYGMPTTIFIGPDGTVLELRTGELTAAQLEAKIESHFKS